MNNQTFLAFTDRVVHSSAHAQEPNPPPYNLWSARARKQASKHVLTFSQAVFVSVALSPLFVLLKLLSGTEPRSASTPFTMIPAAPRC